MYKEVYGRISNSQSYLGIEGKISTAVVVSGLYFIHSQLDKCTFPCYTFYQNRGEDEQRSPIRNSDKPAIPAI